MPKHSKKAHNKRTEIEGSSDETGGELGPLQRPPLPQGRHATETIAFAVPALVLGLVAFAVYFNALSGNFVYDDLFQVVKNPWLKNITNIPTIFSTDAWAFSNGVPTTNYYRPVMHCVYLLTYQIFGLNSLAFHMVNVLFHCGTTILVFLIVQQLLPECQTTPAFLSAPFIAAILFAAHPTHTEPVAWIAGLPDVSFTFFYLLSFYLYMKSRTLQSGSYIASLACFTIAAFSKEPALALPLILFAYDFSCRERRPGRVECAKRYVPYIAISAAYLAMRIHALGGFAPQKNLGSLSAFQYLINAFPLFCRYLGKLLLPTDLNAFYVFHPVASLLEWKALLSAAVTAMAVILTVVAFRKNKAAFLGIVMLVVPLLPVLCVRWVGENAFTDRYLYLPSVGYVFLLALFFSWAGRQLPDGAKVVAAALILLTGIYAAGTVSRNRVWQNEYTLWIDTVEKSPDCALAHNSLGKYYIEQFQAGIRSKPHDAAARGSIGLLYGDPALYNKAMRELQAAKAINPNIGSVHFDIALLYWSVGLKENARLEAAWALSLMPDDVDTQQLLMRVSY